MPIYKATEQFDDKHGHGGVYKEGQLYLHEDRIEVLSTTNNNVKRPVIKELTVQELKDELSKRKIEFDAKAKKDELEELLLVELEK